MKCKHDFNNADTATDVFRSRPVVLSGVVDLLRGVLCFRESLVDGLRRNLRLRQGIYQLLVVENVTFIARCGKDGQSIGR